MSGKKILVSVVCGVLLVLLCLAPRLLSGKNSAPASGEAAGTAQGTAQETPAEALLKFRGEREKTRKETLEQLNRIAADEEADETLRADANREILNLTKFMEQETTLEGVLRARGFSDATVTVHESSVNVLLGVSSLTRAQSAVLLELAIRETGQAGGHVKIIPVG